MQRVNGNPLASSVWDYDEILERIGFGKTQSLLLLISGLTTITSVASQQSMGIIAIASQCEFKTTEAEKGVMMAACVAGIFLSTYIWGYISDAIGRRKVLLCSIFASNILQFISLFVTNIWLFNIINLLFGISLGGGSAAIYPYLSEFNIPRHRAVMISLSTTFVGVTAIYVPATAWLVLSSDWSFHIAGDFVFRPWRLIILLNLLPAFIGGLLLLPYPESPKLLLSQNKEREAKDAVEWISKFNTDKSISRVLNCDDFALKPEIISDENVLGNSRGCGVLVNIGRATVPLFHKPHGFNFTLCCLAVMGMFFSSNGMQFWFPEIVNRSSSTENGTASTVCDILDSSFAKQQQNAAINETLVYCDDTISTKTYIDNIIVGVAFLIGFSLQSALLNPLGRKNVLMAALILSTLSGILLHFLTNSTGVLILFCLYILLPGLSISIMLGAVVDLMPTHLRAKAVSLTMTLGRLGIVVSANLMGIMLQPYCNTTFAMFTTVLFGKTRSSIYPSLIITIVIPISVLVCILMVLYLPIKNAK